MTKWVRSDPQKGGETVGRNTEGLCYIQMWVTKKTRDRLRKLAKLQRRTMREVVSQLINNAYRDREE